MTAITDLGQQLASAFSDARRITPTGWLPSTAAEVYAVQDALIAHLGGGIGGWKVGAPNAEKEPNYAPLPASVILASGAVLPAARFAARWVELEAALRVGKLLEVRQDMPTPSELASFFDAVVPTIECVESRLAAGREAPAPLRLADLQSHGALVVGAPAPLAPEALDLRTLKATLMFGEAEAARTTGGNPAQDVWRLVGWLARHCTERGVPLSPGQIVTTGSCTGLLAAPVDTGVVGAIEGLGEVRLRYSA
ncbi:2-keto-4-pentenoate hydratase [Pseudacidovorax intermedius]|uniref:2-keto-4-pentenoate hydratase n=1 Tax=Pseudacidovorax intermedius TaxID=433924 RepID=A0A370FSE2_9BURK|nr:fumarylacetoacetate hydrolase family protein [Pseudacidovorax intermedius]RDI28678.1 2-keto-4-pentenoate hydratase [Pseudacidovorax intermedius]